MRRPLAIALLVLVALGATSARASADDLARARALDQQGAKAYSEGHYDQAIRFFEESHRLGGPPFELWNIAKCYQRLDQPEQAAEVLERYLTTPSLPADDRDEATKMLEALRRRARQGKSPPDNPNANDENRRIALRGDLGVMLPRYGSIGGSAEPTVAASGTYRFTDVGAASLAAGAMLFVTRDSWDNTVGADNAVKACGTLRNPGSDTALSVFAVVSAGWEIVPRLRAHALAGFGIAAIFADDLGGDVFIPACHPAPAPRPAILFGGQIDYAITPLVRLSALPIVLQLQPSFDGTRSTPIDTSGVWMRATIAVGVGVDL